MTTKENINDREVVIDWEIDYDDLQDDAGDGHVFFYSAYGVGNNGLGYTAIAVICDDELEEMNEIEVAL